MTMASIFDHCYDYGINVLEQAGVSILKKGKLPKHIGFIMDGNRRYAKKLGIATVDGHNMGAKKLEKIMITCAELGIFEISGYCFSIENFNRTKEEVDYLMELFRELFFDIHITFPIIMEKGIKVKFIGELDMLPKDLSDSLRNSMEQTKHHKNGKWNLCFPYASRNEMTTSIQRNIQMVENEYLDLEEISQKTIEDHLDISSPLDLLVRTSGETRLSDFLLFQANYNCQIQYISCQWPELSLWRLLAIFLEYQMYCDSIPKRIH